jgi:hypothetical protein
VRGVDCQAHRHTAVVAQERHHLQPVSRGGTSVKANLRWLCANAHSDAHYLLDLIEDRADLLAGNLQGPPDTEAVSMWPYLSIPIATRRTFGRGVTAAALDGWARYSEAFLRGEYRAIRRLWHTDGEPTDAHEAMFGEGLPYHLAVRLDRAAARIQVAGTNLR